MRWKCRSLFAYTSGKRAFGSGPLVAATDGAGTKGPNRMALIPKSSCRGSLEPFCRGLTHDPRQKGSVPGAGGWPTLLSRVVEQAATKGSNLSFPRAESDRSHGKLRETLGRCIATRKIKRKTLGRWIAAGGRPRELITGGWPVHLPHLYIHPLHILHSHIHFH